MSDYLPRYFEGDTVPITVGAGGCVGGQLITTTGVAAADAETKLAGIPARSAAQGLKVTVYRSGLHTAVASGAIANGDPLCAAAAGKVRKWIAGTDAVASFIGRSWSVAADGVTVTYALFGV